MERITDRSENGTAIYRHPTPEPEGWKENRAAVLTRCCQYEETGLTPEEIQQYKELGTLDELEHLVYLRKRYEDETYDFCGEYGTKDCQLKAIKPHWIPVDEQLPPGKEDVLICTRKGWILVGWYGPNGECWHITPTGTGYLPPDVVAWMPLPEPYKIADKNEDLTE